MRNALILLLCSFVFAVFSTYPQVAQTETQRVYVLKLKANDSFQRTVIANTGAAIDFVAKDYVVVTALLEERNRLEKMGLVIEDLTAQTLQSLGFPNQDSGYHDYSEMTKALQELFLRNEEPTIPHHRLNDYSRDLIPTLGEQPFNRFKIVVLSDKRVAHDLRGNP